jgi:probable rRNA maturation factor
MSLVIANRQRTQKINPRLLRSIVSALFAELKIERAELGIRLVGAREMARVNWQFLQHPGSTDVITFDYLGSDPAPPAAEWQLHGELVICVDDAVAQAREFRTTWPSEVVRYVIHGVLHLRGYDDLQPRLRRRMKREENRLLHRLARRFSLAKLASPARIIA